MSGEATVQVLDTSIDRDGLSVVTTTKTASTPRQGIVYHPATLAAGFPIWFHHLDNGDYLALFGTHWTAATVGSGGPQTYSSHTEVTTPMWVRVSPITGHTTEQGDIPSRLSGTRILLDACSRTGYLFTLGTLDGAPFIQHHRIDDRGNLVLQAEEMLPDTNGVHWSSGLYIDGFYLVIMGFDVAGGIYRRRKPWGRVGQNNGQDPWEYRSAKGWHATDDPEDPPVPQTGGTMMLVPEVGPATIGPVTYAKMGDREWLCVMKGGSVAEFWSSRMVDSAWKKAIPEASGTSVRLQPQLQYNPVALPDGADAAIPYVSTMAVTASGANALQVSWGSLPV
jgi:hypothetical protein